MSLPTPSVELARAGELVLRRRQDDDGVVALELRAGGVFVMDTREVSTEEALARAALDAVTAPQAVLVGGLGLGFTLRCVLDDARVERCTVVELEAQLVRWLRDGTVPHGPALLAEERVRVVVADVAEEVARTPGAAYDLVLLDVDNGPGYLVHPHNAVLYAEPFLRQVRRISRPGGAVAVWSSAEAPALATALEQVFDDVTATPLPVRLQGRAEHYWLYLGRLTP